MRIQEFIPVTAVGHAEILGTHSERGLEFVQADRIFEDKGLLAESFIVRHVKEDLCCHM
jgi:hypothetical protein